ncbi:protein ADP-ribosyltransferase PARP3 [Zea mays]|uniref:Poly [ADP-ribose] polymerase n=1 Tax=Zea mays TaxID=4577 RepID=A0A1D6H9V4_MAIZE|nr:protein ADP-ribosyltransferase PARP3 [Zea mays]AQK71489.1 Poly [ADP-ribose] polymerase 3 [Zea mays]|eukprot:XP_008645748.1 poly [ADP-ribose] polymerase 3 [Zea mays]
MVHETRSRVHAAAQEEGKLASKKQKPDNETKERGQNVPSKNKKSADNEGKDGEPEAPTKSKKLKAEESEPNGREAAAREFAEFCKAIGERLSLEDMRKILQANEQDASGSEDAVVPRCEDMMFYGPLEKCPVCEGQLEFKEWKYKCTGNYSEWARCTFSTNDPSRRSGSIEVPDDIKDDFIRKWLKQQEGKEFPKRDLDEEAHIFSGMMIALSGRMSRSHGYFKEQIMKHGGKVKNSVLGATCVVASPAERDKGGSGGFAEALERGTPVVSENWIIDSIEKKEAQPFAAYDIVTDVVPEGRGLPLGQLDPSEEAIETLAAEVKLAGKRSVHKDSKLDKDGGCVFEKDGIIYNCAFAVCDLGCQMNELCIMQLVMVPGNRLHLFYKKGPIGHDQMAEERVEDFGSRVNDAIKEFVRLFEEVTGNEFEPWERQKKFEKKSMKMYPLDMDVGVDVRHGGAALRQLGSAAAHCKLDPSVSFLLKQLCGQEIYRYALMEMAQDLPDLPIGMLTDLHLKRGEEMLLQMRRDAETVAESGPEADAFWTDASSKWFTLFPTTRPYTMRGFEQIADNVASGFETVRDINDASRLIGDAFRSTLLDDPLSECYKKLGCCISAVAEGSEDYKMVLKYLEKTYEPVEVEDVVYGVSVERIYAVESSAFPLYEEIRNLPNKILLWCGTRSSNLLRHLHKGFLPAVCHLPVPGYMFGKAIVCSDAAAEAARYGFTAVDRPEGYLVLAVASLGEEIEEVTGTPGAEEARVLEEKKVGVKGVGRKTTDESEHFSWRDGVKVPCGKLVPSANKDGPLEYNEYAVYDPKQVSICFLVGVKYEEQNMEVVPPDDQ